MTRPGRAPSRAASLRPARARRWSLTALAPPGQLGAADDPHHLAARPHRPPGTVRIVAQVDGAGQAPCRGPLLRGRRAARRVTDGPPWGVEWERREPVRAARDLAVDADVSAAATARDQLDAQAARGRRDRAEVSSVCVETRRAGSRPAASSPAWRPSRFRSARRRRAADARRSCGPRQLPATFTLLIDSSQSMARRIDFVRDAAAALAGYLRPKDRIIVAPFSKASTT